MNKNGFIATSLLYSFFLLFCVLILLFVGNLSHESILMNKEVDKINEDLHSVKTLKDAEIGSYFRLNICISEDKKDIINSGETLDYILFSNTNNALFVAKNYSFKLSNLELLNNFLNSINVKNNDNVIKARSMSINDYNLINSIDNNDIKNVIIYSDFPSASRYFLASNNINYTNSSVFSLSNKQIRNINNNDLSDDSTFIRLVFEMNKETIIIGGDGILANPYILEGGAVLC